MPQTGGIDDDTRTERSAKAPAADGEIRLDRGDSIGGGRGRRLGDGRPVRVGKMAIPADGGCGNGGRDQDRIRHFNNLEPGLKAPLAREHWPRMVPFGDLADPVRVRAVGLCPLAWCRTASFNLGRLPDRRPRRSSELAFVLLDSIGSEQKRAARV